MTGSRSVELARQDGAEFRCVTLYLDSDGAVRIVAQDMGPAVEEFWGDADYEFGLRISAEAAPVVLFALIQQHYTGIPDAVDRIAKLAKEVGVDPEFWSWA